MTFTSRVADLIEHRHSCRNYLEKPIEKKTRYVLTEYLSMDRAGPLGSRAHFALVAATDQDRGSLKGLGTYGRIRGAAGFVIGAVRRGPHELEDYGYLLERIVLLATDLGLGT